MFDYPYNRGGRRDPHWLAHQRKTLQSLEHKKKALGKTWFSYAIRMAEKTYKPNYQLQEPPKPD
jgi:hypothetical protein